MESANSNLDLPQMLLGMKDCYPAPLHDDVSTPISFSNIINGSVSLIVIVIGCATNLLCAWVFCIKPNHDLSANTTFFKLPTRNRNNRNWNMPNQRRPTPVIYSYLLALSIWDFMTLFPAAFLMYNFPTMYFGRLTIYSDVYSHVYPWACYLSTVALTGSIWTILALSINRYLAICHPLAHRRNFGSNRRTPWVLCCIGVCAVLYALPVLFQMEVDRCFNVAALQQRNGTVVAVDIAQAFATGHLKSFVEKKYVVEFITQTALVHSPWFSLWYRVIGGLILIYVGPSAVLLLLTGCIVYKLRYNDFDVAFQRKLAIQLASQKIALRHQGTMSTEVVETSFEMDCQSTTTTQIRRSISAGLPPATNEEQPRTLLQRKRPLYRRKPPPLASQGRNISSAPSKTAGGPRRFHSQRLFIAVVCKFILCRFLSFALDVLEKLDPASFNSSSLVRTTVDISNLLVIVCSAVSFFVYFTFSKAFRSTLKSICFRCCH